MDDDHHLIVATLNESLSCAVMAANCLTNLSNDVGR